MTIYPAIDLRGGRCVRLFQGKADQETVYFENPVEPAKLWQTAGASHLHVVDLDGAFLRQFPEPGSSKKDSRGRRTGCATRRRNA
jgi:phosphoribosylformimino-5-aminoimidazole carboxamide ribonucleotide (ProFAR) isomerase